MKHPADTMDFVRGLQLHDLKILSRAITLAESTKKSDRELVRSVIKECMASSGNSLRVGITGPPGAGKSTLIDSLGMYAVNRGRKVAVLSVDPSSSRSGGSILGDKTRMQRLSRNENAYVRPSPSSGTQGGIGSATGEAIILCESAGFDFIIVETVGVGQGETAVDSLVDFFLLVQIPGAGDELQGIKRGILELADAIFINKADGDNIKNAMKAASVYRNALVLSMNKDWGWKVPVEICSAKDEVGIDTVWSILNDYHKTSVQCGFFEKKRQDQLKYWFLHMLEYYMEENFWSRTDVRRIVSAKEKTVMNKKASPLEAAEEAFGELKKILKSETNS